MDETKAADPVLDQAPAAEGRSRKTRPGVRRAVSGAPPGVIQGPMRLLWALASVTIVVFGMRYARDILNPVLMALFIVMAVSPIIRWLRAKGVPNVVTLLLVLILFVALGLIFVSLLATSLHQFQAKIPTYTDKLDTMIHSVDQWLLGRGIDASNLLGDVVTASNLGSLAKGLVSGLFGVFSNVLLMFLIVIFMLAEIFHFPAKIDSRFGAESRFAKASAIFGRETRSYLFIKTWLGLITSIIVTAIFYGFGVDFALLWGMLFFLLGFIPNIGFVLALIPPFFVTLLEQGFVRAAIVVGVVIGVNAAFDNFISPRVMGRGLGLTPVAVFLSLVFWAWVLGPVGALVSVPLTIMVKRLFFENYEGTMFLSDALTPTKRANGRRTSPQGEPEAAADRTTS